MVLNVLASIWTLKRWISAMHIAEWCVAHLPDSGCWMADEQIGKGEVAFETNFSHMLGGRCGGEKEQSIFLEEYLWS